MVNLSNRFYCRFLAGECVKTRTFPEHCCGFCLDRRPLPTKSTLPQRHGARQEKRTKQEHFSWKPSPEVAPRHGFHGLQRRATRVPPPRPSPARGEGEGPSAASSPSPLAGEGRGGGTRRDAGLPFCPGGS